MQSERWKQIDQLLDAVLELEPDKRSSYLEQNCFADEELKREVEALLALDEKTDGFIETPAYLDAGELLTRPAARLSESQLLSGGRYQILGALGSGGMGEVYRAKDLRLGREVAIKVLPERLAKDSEASKRFEGEAKTLAVLSHPNIVSIFDIGGDQETSYVVMELLQGETLRTRLQNGPLSSLVAVEIAISIGEGLSAAHSNGVIHRDLKPENIFLTSEGVVKILDFGLARFDSPLSSEERITAPTLGENMQAGLIMGTVGYMSPEQFRAARLDARSDLFSFGCILYEMLTGKRPFVGKTTRETIASILEDEPPPISQTEKDLPPGLNESIHRCLEKRPEDRFQSARDVALELKKVLDDSAIQITSGKSFRSALPRRMIWAATISVLLIAAAWIATFLSDGNPKTIGTIAILPFKPLVAENREEVLEIGMADALIARLSERREIVVRPLSSVRRFGNLDQDAVEAGRVLGVEAVLDGGIQKADDKIRINARLIRIADGGVLWAKTFDKSYTDILAVQDEIADHITAAIAPQLASDENKEVVKLHTENVEAWEYYLRGSYQVGRVTPPDIQRSIENYQKAIDRDPNYARAYAGLARAYISLPPSSDFPPTECFPKAKVAAQKALEIDAQSAEAHAALGSILFWYEWDWRGAEDQCKRALELDPSSADAHYTYAHLLSNLGRHTEALAEMKRARELDPINLRINALEGQFLLHAGQTEKALDKLRKIVEFSPKFWLGHFFISSIYVEKGMYTEAISEADLATEFSGASNHAAAFKGYALAKWGKKAEALEVLEGLSTQLNERFVPPYYFALIYNGLGDTKKTISWLERGLEQRDSKMVFLKVEPKWNNLRSDPGFVNILRKMNLND